LKEDDDDADWRQEASLSQSTGGRLASRRRIFQISSAAGDQKEENGRRGQEVVLTMMECF
jgi:hypothetical protein